MAPTLLKGDELIADKQVFSKEKSFGRGDIILFYPPLLELGLDTYPPNLAAATGFRFLPNTRLYCKRIIGLPGEKIAIEPGKGVSVNDILLDERSYLSLPAFYKTVTLTEIAGENWNHKRIHPYPENRAPIVVPQNCFFVLSDNRRWGHDSQTFGFVRKDNIVGTVIWTSNQSALLRPAYNSKANLESSSRPHL